jgi:integrase
MASLYLRRNQYWIKFRLPAVNEPCRLSLATRDMARARLMRQKVELMVALLTPELSGIQLPEALRILVLPPFPAAQGPDNLGAGEPLAVASDPESPSIEMVLAEFLEHIRSENSAPHVANKLTHLRRFFGARRLGLIHSDEKGVFHWRFLCEVTAAAVRKLIDSLPVGKKTKRHYRETFHGLLEFAMKHSFYEPTNFRYPNPMSALPSYHEKNSPIIFLDREAVTRLLDLLRPYSTVRMAVALMIYAGLRRAEMLWLTRQSLSDGLKYLSIVNKRDEEKDLDSSLKTGERSVPILPELKLLLEEYLPTLRGNWLVPSPTGRLWIGENFGDKHREILRSNGLNHTCLHYRHTFATDRAREGWSLFRISKAMGNSVAVCERYYAAFIDPLLA